MKTFLILGLLLTAVVADVSFLTFKSKACENLGLTYKNEIFKNNEATYLPNIGVMIVNLDSYTLINTLLSNKSEFHECVKNISKNDVVKLDDPIVDQTPNESREQ